MKKKILLISAAIATMVLVGCKKDLKVVTLGVDIEKAVAENKLVIDENRNPVFLQSGEQVNVNGTNYDVIYNSSSQTYEVNVQAGEGVTEFYGAYPTTLFNTITATGFTGTTNQPIHLSRWQHYEHNNGVQNVKLPAAAVLTDNSKKLKFYNLCSLLEIQWTNTSENYDYDIIGIEVTVPGTALYGDGQANLVEINDPDDPSNNVSRGLTMTGTGEKYNRVNLDITEDDRETVGHTENHNVSRKYYVILPPFTSKNVTVRIQTVRHTEGEENQTIENQKIRTITAATTSAVSLPRNYIVPLHISSEPKEDNSLTGYFSVRGTTTATRIGEDNYKVVFSRGNLQHVETINPSNGTWKFADRQYDFYGRKNVSSDAYNVSTTMDLFCWSNVSDGDYGMHVYDNWEWDNYNLSGFVDWGDDKEISGDAAGTWYTLSSDEWYYLFHLRVGRTGDNLRGKAKITGIKGHEAIPGNSSSNATRDHIEGFILMPDDWTRDDLPTGLDFTPAASVNGQTPYENEYTVSEWLRLEAAGAMFLPAAGYGSTYHDDEGDRTDGSDIYSTYEVGQYWTRTFAGTGYPEAHYVSFQYNNYHWFLQTSSGSMTNATFANYDMQTYHMRSVRLVKPAPGYTRPASK